ncbi:MAG: hypothetical protein JWP58_4584 [Hymenobacter sp.]|nr:hypothetical protein [Hymenobacter sp.]
MIEALVSGKLHGQPAQKISKTGKPFVVAKVRAHAGDAVALAGSLTPKAWTDPEGITRPALDLVASQVLSAYHVTLKRRALERKPLDPSEPQPSRRPDGPDELDDGAPLDF